MIRFEDAPAPKPGAKPKGARKPEASAPEPAAVGRPGLDLGAPAAASETPATPRRRSKKR